MRIALVLALLASSAPVLAATGNAQDGRIKAYTCTGCHGVANYKNAYPHYHVPKIYGQTEAYLVNALNAYRNGERSHPTMVAQGQSLSDQDIADIAAFLATKQAK